MSEQHDEREAMDRLNDQNRILHEARMLPTNKPLTQQQTFAVMDAFTRYIDQRSIPVAQVAREVNYSESVLSQWKGNDYRGDADKVTRAVNDWMERDRRRREAEAPKDSVPTWVAQTMRSVAIQADKRGMMAAIVAPAGCGKTKVLRALTEEMRGVYLYCTDDMTPRGFLQSLAMACGCPHYGTRTALLRAIVEKLKGTKRIIFLDEAHQLAGKAIGAVRSVHDQAGVPIVMAGTADILQAINDRKDGRGQMSSRCLRFDVMTMVTNAEDPDGTRARRDLFTVEEIRAFFGMHKMRIADDGMQMLWQLACLPNHGTLRLAGAVAATAADICPGVEVLTRRHLMEAMTLMFGGEAKYLRNLADRHQEMRKAAVA